MRLGRTGAFAVGALAIDALGALLEQRRTAERAKRAALAQAQNRLDEHQRRLTRLEDRFARACREFARTGIPPAANLERAVEAARAAVSVCRAGAAELRDQALEAIGLRAAVEALQARRRAETAAREARKEEQELEEANQA